VGAGAGPSARFITSRIDLIYVRHALWRQHRSGDPNQWDEEPEDKQDPVPVLERPDAKKDQQKDVNDA
jgi:hypothetical protein